MNGTKVVRLSKFKVIRFGLLFFGLSLPFWLSGHYLWAWGLSIGGLIFISSALTKVAQRPSVLVMDNEGISIPQLGVNKIIWRDIKDLNVIRYPRAGSFVCLYLYDEDKYIAQLPENRRYLVDTNRRYGFSAFSFNAEGLDTPITRICMDIREHIALAKGAVAQ